MNAQIAPKKYKKQTNKRLMYNDVKYQVKDYKSEQELLNRENYCPYECCDGFLPVFEIDNISDDLKCYVIN
jgi:hypothetical protein